MAKRIDSHLGTGEYSPERYWNQRATEADGDKLAAVCMYLSTGEENQLIDDVQHRLIVGVLKTLSGGSALELGCGVGRWVPRLEACGFSYTGVDISEQMLKRAQENFPGRRFEKLDGLSFPFDDESFDVAMTVAVLHHNPHIDQDVLVAEISRVLKPGGHFVMFENTSDDQAFNLFPRKREKWMALARDHGMETISFQGTRYKLTRSVAQLVTRIWRAFARRVGMPTGQGASPFDRMGLWLKLDHALNPVIVPLLPESQKIAGLFAFRKAR